MHLSNQRSDDDEVLYVDMIAVESVGVMMKVLV